MYESFKGDDYLFSFYRLFHLQDLYMLSQQTRDKNIQKSFLKIPKKVSKNKTWIIWKSNYVKLNYFITTNSLSTVY